MSSTLDFYEISKLSEKERFLKIEEALYRIIENEEIKLSKKIIKNIISRIYESSFGFGPISSLMDDADISEVMINNHNLIYYEKNGKIYKSDIEFESNKEVRDFVDKILNPLGLRLDESSPMVDARIGDGSRINAVVSPVNVNDISVTIRRFKRNLKDVSSLMELGTLTKEIAELIKIFVHKKANIILTGATSTGKTTMLNILSCFIPKDERVITIEDTIELNLEIENIVKLESKPPNLEEKGEITIRDLVRNAMRMRPDRIIVGEVRGNEIIDVLQAMNTGHKGSMTTVHANSGFDLISRLESMLMIASPNLNEYVARKIILSSVEIIIFLERLKTGERIISEIGELSNMKNYDSSISDIDIKNICLFNKKKYETKKYQIKDCFNFSGYFPKRLN
ncbi:MAG: CpaF family protein [Actinomycetota bacterium]|nr:CpaF family protein [Actinomycetota bacterium]